MNFSHFPFLFWSFGLIKSFDLIALNSGKTYCSIPEALEQQCRPRSVIWLEITPALHGVLEQMLSFTDAGTTSWPAFKPSLSNSYNAISLSLSLRRQFIFDDKQHFFKEMSIYIWALTKFPGLSKINDLTRKINQQPTPSHGMQERGAASRVKFYQIIGIQRWGIFCVFPCLDTQLYKVEGDGKHYNELLLKISNKEAHCTEFFEFAKTSTNLAGHRVPQLFLKLNFNLWSRFCPNFV